MSIIGHRIRAVAVAGVLCVGLSRSGVAQNAVTSDGVPIETVNMGEFRAKEPAKAPIAKSETKGRAPSTDATWVPGFWNLQADPNTGSRAGWVWVGGKWHTPPARHVRWVRAHWGWSDEWWHWIPGHWAQL